MGTMRTSLVFSLAALGLVLVACGSAQSTSTGDGGADGGPSTPAACGAIDGACSGEGTCCLATISDGFGPEGYRCTSGTWKRDASCEPPPPSCTAPLTGSLTRGDGAKVTPTCFLPQGINGVVAAAIAVDPGGQL